MSIFHPKIPANRPVVKFGSLRGSESTAFQYPNIFQEGETSGPDRLIIAPAANQVDLLLELSRTLPEPFGILYVLTVPRAGTIPGRYQSPAPSTRREMEAFFIRFREYFESDGRHHIWLISLPESDTLVYDNHNLIYAYGILENYKRVLRRRGLVEKPVEIPFPHIHVYSEKNDPAEKDIMKYWDWIHFPLVEDVDE